jgi:Cu+-exporting ATPase
MVAAVESHSEHFLAREILRKTAERDLRVEKAHQVEILEGQGIRGWVEGRQVTIGNHRFMDDLGMAIPGEMEGEGRLRASRGMTVLYFGWDEQVRGLLSFGDTLKPGAREVISTLQSRGICTWLVSGDANETTSYVAEAVGTDHAQGQVLPADKVEIIKTLQEKGHRVGMVGDGINDAAALAQADVGFALGTGTQIAQEASDITLLSGDPTHVLKVLDLSALNVRTMRQNLFLAFIYNGLGIPLAISGVVSPLLAVFAMFASSLTVIGNTLRIARKEGLGSGV